MTTIGTSPKAIAAVIMAILSYLLTQELVDFPAWADLLITTALVGGGAAGARPGQVVDAGSVRAPGDDRLSL